MGFWDDLAKNAALWGAVQALAVAKEDFRLTVPYPVEKAKFIIRKYEEECFAPMH